MICITYNDAIQIFACAGNSVTDIWTKHTEQLPSAVEELL